MCILADFSRQTDGAIIKQDYILIGITDGYFGIVKQRGTSLFLIEMGHMAGTCKNLGPGHFCLLNAIWQKKTKLVVTPDIKSKEITYKTDPSIQNS